MGDVIGFPAKRNADRAPSLDLWLNCVLTDCEMLASARPDQRAGLAAIARIAMAMQASDHQSSPPASVSE